MRLRLIAFLALAPIAHGQSANDAVTATVTPSWISQYYFRGQHVSGASFQPDVEADYRGLAVGTWASFPETGKVEGPSSGEASYLSDPEVDYYASYTLPLTANLSLQGGATAYTFPRAITGSKNEYPDRLVGAFRSTLEPNLALNYAFHGVRLTPKIYYDIVRESMTGEVSGALALPLRSIGSELDWNGTVGLSYSRKPYDIPSDAPIQFYSHESIGYWSTQVSLPYQLPFGLRATVAAGAAGSLGGTTVLGIDGPNSLQAELARFTSSATAQGLFSVAVAYTF